MKGVNPSIYLRLPFEVEDRSALFSLTLSMRYNDGYVAFLNGVEVARRQRAGGATELEFDGYEPRRRKDDALMPEEVDLTPFLDLVAGRATMCWRSRV